MPLIDMQLLFIISFVFATKNTVTPLPVNPTKADCIAHFKAIKAAHHRGSRRPFKKGQCAKYWTKKPMSPHGYRHK